MGLKASSRVLFNKSHCAQSALPALTSTFTSTYKSSLSNLPNADRTYWWDSSGNGFGFLETEVTGGTLLCNANINDGFELRGYCQNNPNLMFSNSIIVLCKDELSTGETLTEKKASTYDNDPISLEDIARQTASFTLIHELSHTAAILDGENLSA
jgi:hypothetical protein